MADDEKAQSPATGGKTPPATAGVKRLSPSEAAREARLKAALKANMAKRKAQVRARGDGAGAQDAPDGQEG